jgi:phospholipase C
MELSEHPPYMPKDGAWLQNQVIQAVASSPKYSKTALIISYDETGGWGDHVVPFTSPNGTGYGEWVVDPFRPDVGPVPWGPGFRVPLYVISPWTRGGNVFTEPADHTSQIMFLEKWAKAKYGKDITNVNISPWRRQYMSDLVNIFDFTNPDTSVPALLTAPEPMHLVTEDSWTGTYTCLVEYLGRSPPIPYGSQNVTSSLWTETGYKKLRGALTEGRYLVFEDTQTGECVVSTGRSVGFGSCGNGYSSPSARWVVHQVGGAFSSKFQIQLAGTSSYVSYDLTLVNGTTSAGTFSIQYGPSGYTVSLGGRYSLPYNVYSVNY